MKTLLASLVAVAVVSATPAVAAPLKAQSMKPTTQSMIKEKVKCCWGAKGRVCGARCE